MLNRTAIQLLVSNLVRLVVRTFGCWGKREWTFSKQPDKMMNETPKPTKSAKSTKTTKNDTNEKEHERIEQLSNERQKQVDNVRRVALIETKMRLKEREKDLAEINALMMEQQREHDSQLRKQAKMVEQAALKLSQERTQKLAAYDDVEKLQVNFGFSSL